MATILIVDDERLLRAALRAALEGAGHRVLEASDGAAALAAAERQVPDLALMDMQMPGMDGIQACAALHARPALAGLPVIFLSGQMGLEERVTAFRAGAVDCLAKPFPAEELLARVRLHLELREQRARLETVNGELGAALEEAARLNGDLLQVNRRLREAQAPQERFLERSRRTLENPLAGIQQLGRSIAAGAGVPQEARDLAGRIVAHAGRLDLQVRNLFCAADLEAGEGSPRAEPVVLAALVDEVVAGFAQEAAGRGLAITVLREPGSLDEQPLDPDMVRLLLANLLANALEHSPDRGRVQVRCAAARGCLELEVADQGPGLGGAWRPDLPLGAGTAGSGPGQGLGLAVVEGLLDLLGGTLEAASGQPEGTRMVCRFPPLAGEP
jgi:DNA-binding response OmpR family regulator